jgi:hypothetical protein
MVEKLERKVDRLAWALVSCSLSLFTATVMLAIEKFSGG